MATTQEDGESCTGERMVVEDVSYPLLLLQATLTSLLVFTMLGWGLLTLNAILDPERVATEFLWASPYIAGIAGFLLLINYAST